MKQFSDFKMGDKVKIFTKDKGIITNIHDPILTQNLASYQATVIGSSEHYANGKTTKHTIIGWQASPFPSGLLPNDVQVDYAISSMDKANYRYKAFVSPDGYCEDWIAEEEKAKSVKILTELAAERAAKELQEKKMQAQEAQEKAKLKAQIDELKKEVEESKIKATNGNAMAREEYIKQTIAKKEREAAGDKQMEFSPGVNSNELAKTSVSPKKTTLKEAKLNDKVRIMDHEGKLYDGVVFATKTQDRFTGDAREFIMIGFTSPIPDGWAREKGYARTCWDDVDREDRFTSWACFSTYRSCEILSTTYPKERDFNDKQPLGQEPVFTRTLREAKLGDTVRYKLGDKVVRGVLIAGNVGSAQYGGELALVGFKTTDDLPSNPNTYTLGNPSSRFRYYGSHIQDTSTFIASAAERMDLKCEIIPAIEPTPVKKETTVRDAKLGERIKIQLGGKAINATIIARHPKAVFAQDYVAIGISDLGEIPAGVSYSTAKPTSIETNYEEYLDSSAFPFPAYKTVPLDLPCEILSPTNIDTSPIKPDPIIDLFGSTAGYIVINDGYSYQGWTSMPITLDISNNPLLQTNGMPYSWDGYSYTTSPTIPNQTTKAKTLKCATLGDRVVITYQGHSIEGTIIGTKPVNGSPYILVGYKPDQKSSWECKVVVGKLGDRAYYSTYADDIDEYEYGTSFGLDHGCQILPPLPKPTIEEKPKERSLSPFVALGAALVAGLLAPSKPIENVRVQTEKADVQEEEMTQDEVVRSEVG